MLAALITILAGCTFHDDPEKSVFSEGLWIIPTILFLAAGWNLYMSIKKAKSGAHRQVNSGGYVEEKPLKFWEVNNFKYFVGFLVAAAAVIILVISDR